MKSYKIGKTNIFVGNDIPADCKSVLVLLKKGEEWVLGFNSQRKGWELPGGHLEVSEDIFQAAARESLEEVGAIVGSIEAKGYYVLPDGHKTAFVTAELIELSDKPLEHEISHVQTFKEFPDDLTFKDGLYAILAELIATEDYKGDTDYTVSSVEAWDKVWENGKVEKYAKEAIRTEVSTKKINLLTSLGIQFQEDEKILESGCGDATLVLSLAKVFNIQAYGVDFSPVALEKAKQNAEKFGHFLHTRLADARNTPYQDETFDKVISLGIIEHFKSPELALSELFRVTKPNGQLILMTPNKNSFGPIDRHIQQMKGQWPFGYQTEYTPKELKTLAEKAGFVTSVSRSSQRPIFAEDKPNMRTVAILDKLASSVVPDRGFYSWFVGFKP